MFNWSRDNQILWLIALLPREFTAKSLAPAPNNRARDLIRGAERCAERRSRFMKRKLSTRIFCGFAVLLATTGLGVAQTVSNAPTVSHAATSAMSPRLSDMPLARAVPENQQLKIVPPPKPVPPRQSGPGGA